VPGHEIAGTVSGIGQEVTRFELGDRVGVGNMVDSCRRCLSCLSGMEQYCERRGLTYNAIHQDGSRTQGGYSEKIVVDEAFVARIPKRIPLQNAAPLLCAGITLYSALRHWNAGPGKSVAVVGLGGLGHIGVQISRALGANTTVLELSPAKRNDALRLGAHDFRITTEASTFADLAGAFDLIICTVPANINLDAYLALLALDGTFVNLAIPENPLVLSASALLFNRRSIAGTRSGGLRETQEMIDFCAEHGIHAEVEVIHADQIDEAFERLLRGDVRFRFVVDIGTMAAR
jgi:uncharacterized zinc-type alcohol dehydrogenase-like protein